MSAVEVLILVAIALALWAWKHWSSPDGSDSVSPRVATSPRPDAATQHIQEAKSYVASLRMSAEIANVLHQGWLARFAGITPLELDALSGVEFEEWLAGVFRLQGFQVSTTPSTGDFGVDLVLIRDGRKIAVQAKRYKGDVGVAAIQEVSAGCAYYQCDEAWVVTTSGFTPSALRMGGKLKIQVKGRDQVELWRKNAEEMKA